MRTLIVAACLTATAQAATAEQVRCPEIVGVEQRAVSPPGGWQARDEGTPARLASIIIFDGPPEDGASLVPDQNHSGPRPHAVWKLDAKNERGYWIGCVYASTTIMLTKKLPPVSSCDASYDASVTVAGLPSVTAIECK